MNRFFRKCLEPLKYGAAVVAGGLYVWAIIILLNDDNWVGISALTTMLLAIAAFWTIWEGRSLRKRSEKQDSLRRIDTWASNLIAELSKTEGTKSENFSEGFVVSLSDVTNVAFEFMLDKGNLSEKAKQAFENLGIFVKAINNKEDKEKILSLMEKLTHSLIELRIAVSIETVSQRQSE